jgi:hypothetical protein
MHRDPRFILDRVKLVIPPPKELHARVKLVFDKYRNAACALTDRPLFDKDLNDKSDRILERIDAELVSDIVGGPPLYVELVGKDKYGLMRYKCRRGMFFVINNCVCVLRLEC